MNLTSKGEIKNLLKKYQIRPSKGLGQNFLIDRGVVKKVIEAAELNLNDIVLEIGPGLGTLTQELAKKAGKVVAVEKDLKMIEVLKETLKDFKNIEVIRGDIRKINIKYCMPNAGYKVVANLPFYLTAPVIRKFLEAENPPKEMILIVQKEVGQRICAKPPDMNLLAVSVQFYSKPKIISYISKKSFWPQPKVDSAIIKIVPGGASENPAAAGFSDGAKSKEFRDLFFKIVKAGFSQPRKQLINNLSKELKIEKEKIEKWLIENGIQPTQRAETLNIEDWVWLTKESRQILNRDLEK